MLNIKAFVNNLEMIASGQVLAGKDAVLRLLISNAQTKKESLKFEIHFKEVASLNGQALKSDTSEDGSTLILHIDVVKGETGSLPDAIEVGRINEDKLLINFRVSPTIANGQILFTYSFFIEKKHGSTGKRNG